MAAKREPEAPALRWMALSQSRQTGFTSVTFRDVDTLRVLEVTLKHGDDFNEDLDDMDGMPDKILAIFPSRMMANLAPEIWAVVVSESGEILHSTTDEQAVCFGQPYLPSVAEYGLPCSPRRLRQPKIPVVLRSQLTVVKRIAHGIDKVSYPDPSDPSSDRRKVAVFKYPFRRWDVVGGGVWSDIQILARLKLARRPPHPNLVSLLSVVVEEISGLGVVGFTMPFISGYTLLHQQPPWSFSQKWLRELIGAVDFLNLQCGILHNDISTQNMFISTVTNSLVLLDLGSAQATTTWRTGGERCAPRCPSIALRLPALSPDQMHEAAQGDVELTILAVANHLIRDSSLDPGSLGERNEIGRRLRNRELWVPHANTGASTGTDILALYDTLMTWSDKRRDGPLPCDAPHPITLPPYRYKSAQEQYEELPQDGCHSLCWVRPPLSQLDPNRPILATGRYADEEPETKFIPVPDPSRGFPQPSVSIREELCL